MFLAPSTIAAAPQAAWCSTLQTVGCLPYYAAARMGSNKRGCSRPPHLLSQARIGVVRCEVKKKCSRAFAMRG